MATRTLRTRAAANVKSSKEPQQLSSPPATPKPNLKPKKSKKQNATPKVKQEETDDKVPTPKSSRKQKDAKPKVEDDEDELPHGLGKRPRSPEGDTSEVPEPAPKKAKKGSQKPSKKVTKDLAQQLEDPQNQVIADKLKAEFEDPGAAQSEPSAKKTKKGKKDTAYGHTAGTTPFPDYARPTPDECHEVTKLLEKVHGKVHVPKEVRTGSMDVAGCGEVPHVLDALVRTRLSANTNNQNSSTAFQGIVKAYGTIKDRAGREMVDWNKVRLEPQQTLFKAIEKGGLANVKSKDIKKILDMVYEENQARRDAIAEGKEVPGLKDEAEEEKKDEVEQADDEVISLDYVHLLSKEDAFNKLIEYPGIGAKTASCVVLFCLQRPSFAVDTHVWRLCSWLGWVPKKATRDQTFSHCEVRIPDELKYPLHYLLIKHGKTCPKCQAKVNKGTQNPKLEECVIEHLVKRFNHKEGGVRKVGKSPKKNGTKKNKNDDDDEETAEESGSGELSDVGSEPDGEVEPKRVRKTPQRAKKGKTIVEESDSALSGLESEEED